MGTPELDAAIKEQADDLQPDHQPDFARIMHSELVGQVLLMIDVSATHENMVAVSIFFSHAEYGIVSLALNFNADEEGIFEAEEIFLNADIAKIHELIAEPLKQLGIDATAH